MTRKPDPLRKVRLQACGLVNALHRLAEEAPKKQQPAWGGYVDRVEEVVQFLDSLRVSSAVKRPGTAVPRTQWLQFGRLLRDRRNAAGYSRVRLARKAKLSDATVKFAETARHPPSRATLIRLVGVAELKLSWADVPGQPVLQQCLLPCQPGDFLLLDIQAVCAATDQLDEIRRRDKQFGAGVPESLAAWLGGPLWRHCGAVAKIEFSWAIDTNRPIPGSYALEAVATVQSRDRPERKFSVFRFSRYDLTKLGDCLRTFGWDEVAAIPYEGEHSLRLYRKQAL